MPDPRHGLARVAGRLRRTRWLQAAVPSRVSGLPPRQVRVLLAGSPRLAQVLAPEWHQQVTDGAAPPSADDVAAADLVLVEWSGGTDPGADARTVRLLTGLAESSGTPVLVWDTARGPEVPAADTGEGVVIGVDDPVRRDRYAPRRVEDLGPTFQQRVHRPTVAGGHHRVVRVRTDVDGPVPGGVVVRAAATGAVVVTDRPEAAAAVDGVVLAADATEQRWAEVALRRHAELRARQATRSTRAVLGGWSASVRAETILRATGVPGRPSASVSAVVPTMRPDQLDHVLDFIAGQEHPHVQLVLVTHGFEVPGAQLRRRAAERDLDEVVVVPADASLTLGACMNRGIAAAEGSHVAKMDDDNHYGRHYLTDLLAAFEYTDAQVVGKWAHLVHLRATGATLLRFPEAEHCYRPLVQGGTLLMPRQVAVDVGFEDLPRRVDTTFLQKVTAAGGRVYSADRFGFVSVRGTDPQGHTWRISDLELLAKPSRLLFYGDPVAYADA